jgi:hypothetical protein
VGPRDQAVQPDGDGLDAGRPAGEHEAHEPRRDPRQVAPADRQRRERVAQHPRHLAHDARHGGRHDAGRREDPRVAARGLVAGLLRVEDGHPEAGALQVQGAADADHARADDGDVPRDH